MGSMPNTMAAVVIRMGMSSPASRYLEISTPPTRALTVWPTMAVTTPKLAADMNIATQVVDFLRQEGIDVVSAREEGWNTWSDSKILEEATHQKRYVLTHDRDFGMLAVHRGQPHVCPVKPQPCDLAGD